MFVFSDPHAWEGDDSVRQILVFPNRFVQQSFEKEYNNPEREKTISGYPNENGIGAIYKIRAIRNSDSRWITMIRCGFTGEHLYEYGTSSTPELALREGLRHLYFAVGRNLTDRMKQRNEQRTVPA